MCNPYNESSYGIGNKKLVIFAPIMAQWSGIIDLKGKFDKYTEDYIIYYIDTLSIIADSQTITEARLKFKEYIETYHLDAKAMLGFAFGGTLLQSIPDDIFINTCRLGFISSPTYADNELTAKLNPVIALLNDKQLLRAMNIMRILIQPENKIEQSELKDLNFIKDIDKAQKRLLQGYNLILQANDSKQSKKISKESIAIVGQYSQLATLKNVLLPKDQIKIIANAGMRVLESHSKLVYIILDKLLLREN